MKDKFVARHPLVGEFNTNYFVDRGAHSTALLRVAKENRDTFANLIFEYQQLGFFQDGGKVRRRGSSEQYGFSMSAAMAGLRVLPPIPHESGKLMYPYLPEAMPLHQYLTLHPSQVARLVYTLFQDLYLAHEKGFIYGDRWSGNILVDPRFGVVNIDFDIEISGSKARELDVSQVIYHTLWSCMQAEGIDTIQLVSSVIGLRSNYDQYSIVRYLKGLVKFLDNTKVGGIGEQVEQLIAMLKLDSNKII